MGREARYAARRSDRPSRSTPAIATLAPSGAAGFPQDDQRACSDGRKAARRDHETMNVLVMPAEKVVTS